MSSRQSQTTRIRLITVVLVSVLAVVGLALVPGVAVAENGDNGEDTQPLPAAYYGDVVVDGEDADGVTVTAEINGEVRGSITAEDGEYGGPGTLDEKLTVDGEDGEQGEEIEFFVDGEPADTDPGSIEYTPGVNEQIDLTVDELPEEEDASVSGEVTDFEGDPVDEGTIELFVDDSSVETDDLSDGSYEFAGLSPATYTLEVTEVPDNEDAEVDVELDAGDDVTENIQLEEDVVEDDDDDTTNGGGGGGGAAPADDDTDDAVDDTDDAADDADEPEESIEDTRETVDQSEPDVDTERDIEDSDPDTPGVTVDTSDETGTVDSINFADEATTGSVNVREYSDESVTESTSNSLSSQLDQDVRSVGSVADITVSDDEGQPAADTAATVTMGIDADDVENPDNVVINHETDDGWEQLETTIEEETDDRVRVSGDVDGFSLFAVAETTPAEDEEPADDEPVDEEPADDGIGTTGLIGLVVAIALVVAAAVAYRQMNDGGGDNEL